MTNGRRPPLRGRTRVGVALVLLVGSMIALPARSAYAACSTAETNIQWGDKPSGSWRFNALGVSAHILIVNRDLDPNCLGSALTASTSLEVLKASNPVNWVETGWKEDYVRAIGIEFHWFTELGLNGNVSATDGAANSWPCNTGPGSYARFVTRIGSGTDWDLKIDCLDGTGVHLLHTYASTGYSAGSPQIEVARIGGNATGASDTRNTVNFLNASLTWTDWTSGHCWDNQIANWQGEMPTTTTFDTFKTSSPVCQ